VDGSRQSAAALDWAADLALTTGAEIVAVHAFDLAPYRPGAMGPPHTFHPGAVADSLVHELDASGARLDSVSRTTPLDGARSCSLLLYGAAAPMGPNLEDRPDAARLRRLFPPQDTVFWPVDRF
jgi:nucleotide-binding universal stress UspA family protein